MFRGFYPWDLGLRFTTATYLRQLEGGREVDFIVFQKAPIFVGRVIVPWDGFANSFRVRSHQNAANPGRCPGLELANAFGVDESRHPVSRFLGFESVNSRGT